MSLVPGDSIILYTDGITEGANRDGEEFGLARLVDSVRSNSRCPQDLITHVMKEVSRFLDGEAPKDDQTLLVLRAD